MNQLIQLLDRWQSPRVMVVGDFMLDHYVYGNAERLSPDAPVPVLAAQRDETRAGGASNVAILLRALRCEVTCIGITGNDQPAHELAVHLGDAGCDSNGLLRVDDRPTTVKRSYIGLAQHRHPQKMFRVDWEDHCPVDQATEQRIIDQVAASIERTDVLCIEDYAKGLLTERLCAALIDMARKAQVPVLIDPAVLTSYQRYRGATLITPNRFEAARATGLPTDRDEQLDAVADRLLESLELDAVVITLDRHGALLAEQGQATRRVPTIARSVYDVTGAGDMVLAMLAAARANGADWPMAVELANIAGGLEVESFGVTAIPLEQIHLALLKARHDGPSKLRDTEHLLPELAAYRQQGRTIAFTNGCFDIVHAGHVEMLRAAKATADLLVLAVNTDQSIRVLKGADRPIINETDRICLLSELNCVDYIVLFGDGSGGAGDTPDTLIRQIKPDVLVKGGDYQREQVVGHDIVEQYGGRVELIPLVEGRSTSSIVDRIRNGR